MNVEYARNESPSKEQEATFSPTCAKEGQMPPKDGD